MTYQTPWRLQLQPGKFREAHFFTKSVQTQVGRRVALHEYPQRDTLYPEDLGLKADQFTIEALIIGPDYFIARDALIAALKQPGPGTLIHPYYGQRTVVLASPARISESSGEGGLARFSLDFVDAGANTEPSSRQDTRGAVEIAADDALLAVAADFCETFDVAGLPDFAYACALDLAGDLLKALSAARRALAPDMSALADYQAMLSRASAGVKTLIRAPTAYAQETQGLIGALQVLSRTPGPAITAYRGLMDFGEAPPVAVTTPVRQRQASNQAAQIDLVRRSALIEAARASSRIEVETYDRAVALRDELAARLDDQASGNRDQGSKPNGVGLAPDACHLSPDLYQALTALRVALSRDLSGRAIDAPRLSSVTLPMTLPALVCAYRLYGDAAQADDLIARNPRLIRHPGFVPGGAALEIVAGGRRRSIS
jgi:prophage DNA circulation protein